MYKKIAKYFTEKKILRQLGTTMFKKSKKKIPTPPKFKHLWNFSFEKKQKTNIEIIWKINFVVHSNCKS